MKRLTIFLFACLVSSLSFAQVETTKIQGETYFVYPYPHIATSVTMPDQIKTYDDFMLFLENNFIKSMSKNGKGLSPAEKEQAEKMKEVVMEKFKKQKKEIKELMTFSQNYKGPKLKARYKLNKDITPSLDPLPDGKYVQYFRANEFAEMYDTTIIASLFEIKNNTFEGEAVRFYPSGDTALVGVYKNGLKSGSWRYIDMHFPGPPKMRRDIELEEEEDSIYVEKIITAQFVNGSKEGLYKEIYNGYAIEIGSYFQDNKTGLWKYYKKGTDSLIFQYEIDRSIPQAFQPIIRKNANCSKYSEGNDSMKFSPNLDLEKFVTFNKPTKDSYLSLRPHFSSESYKTEFDSEIKGLEYELERMEERAYEAGADDYYSYEDYYDKWVHLDSVGYYIPYKGKITSIYPNGQLHYELEIVNGKLQKEPTIYFDNGKVFSEVYFNKDSSYYEIKKYNYMGDLVTHSANDSSGLYLKSLIEIKEDVEYLERDGIVHKMYLDDLYQFEYYNYDTLNHHGLEGEILLSQIINAEDSLIISKTIYNADKRTKTIIQFNDGSEIDTNYFEIEEYAENFESFNSTGYSTLEKFRIAFVRSYSISENVEFNDSLPRTAYIDRYYNGNSQYEVLLNNKPFNGLISLKENKKKDEDKYSYKNNEVVFEYGTKPNKVTDRKEQIKQIKKALKGSLVFEKDFLKQELKAIKKKKYESWGPGSDLHSHLREMFPEINDITKNIDRIDLNLVNGKVEGFVTTYNEELVGEYKFKKGVLDGKQKEYDSYFQTKKVKAKKPKNEFDYLFNNKSVDKKGKDIQYLRRTFQCDEGLKNGNDTYFNYNGDTIASFPYNKDLIHGEAFTDTEYMYSQERYEFGVKDGRTKVYFKYPGEDSVLIYNLKFENGNLQGKSQVFHKNGKLSMEGFFLDNQPIETYHGYDSLGSLIHYVKFNKGFVKEEKIWEENELSALYEFKWQDSVTFNTFDFVENTSFIDEYTSKLNLNNYNLYRPYYGRTSKVHDESNNYYLTKYYPTSVIARTGKIVSGDKDSLWKYYRLDEKLNYSVNYNLELFDINDSLELESKGIYVNYDENGDTLSVRHIIEMSSKYDCANSDHYETRQYYFPANKHNKEEIGSHVQNFYDSDVLQSEGGYDSLGLPTGVWKYYDPNGRINQVGEYKNGKKHGRWLMGDLSKVKYLGDICLNPNMPNIEEVMEYKEKELEIEVLYFEKGKIINSSSYDINLNKD